MNAEQIGHKYSDCFYYALLRKYITQELNSMLCWEYIVLKQYDELYNTEFLDTIDLFYLFAMNVSQTADQLHIHRNTLLYH
ncbi:MAG: helix-turn-helix domain-containing protein [Lachnospiraceae bacterium]